MGLFDRFKKKNSEKDVVKKKQSAEKTNKIKSGTKRKTLVKDFDEIFERGNEEEIKAIFEKCDINAYGGYDKTNALSFKLSENIMKWLVEQGADIDYKDTYHNTPLHHQVINPNGNPEFLIRLGANIEAVNSRNETPLFYATQYFRLNHLKTLVEAGANINAKNDMNQTPLLKAMAVAKNANIPDLVIMIKYLIDKGAKLSGEEQKQVERIGTDFEWFRDRINKDYIDEIESSLKELYKIFNVMPIPKRVVYDGKSKIKVKAKKWEDQHEELWQLLVPSCGHAPTLQGEVIRISGKLSQEILDNGKMNWDKEYLQMVQALLGYLSQGNQLTESENNEFINIINKIKQNHAWNDELSRLSELCVKWVLLNTEPIQLGKAEYKR